MRSIGLTLVTASVAGCVMTALHHCLYGWAEPQMASIAAILNLKFSNTKFSSLSVTNAAALSDDSITG